MAWHGIAQVTVLTTAWMARYFNLACCVNREEEIQTAKRMQKRGGWKRSGWSCLWRQLGAILGQLRGRWRGRATRSCRCSTSWSTLTGAAPGSAVPRQALTSRPWLTGAATCPRRSGCGCHHLPPRGATHPSRLLHGCDVVPAGTALSCTTLCFDAPWLPAKLCCPHCLVVSSCLTSAMACGARTATTWHLPSCR